MIEILIGSMIIVVLVLGLTLGLLTVRRRLIPAGGLDVVVNGNRHVPAQRGDTLLGALHGGGVRIPAACGGKTQGRSGGGRGGPAEMLAVQAQDQCDHRELRGQCDCRQHPVGRAELVDLGAVITNKFAVLEILHTLPAAYTLSAFFVMGISAYHLLKKQEIEFEPPFPVNFQLSLKRMRMTWLLT